MNSQVKQGTAGLGCRSVHLLLGLVVILGAQTAARAETGPSEPSVQFANSSYSINENGTVVAITVTLSAPSALPVTVSYATSNGTATAPVDYTSASGVLTFTPGATSTTFTVAVRDDQEPEPSESFIVRLSGPVNASLGVIDVTSVTILDNDAWPALSLIPYRTGVNSGQVVSEAVKEEGDPLKYIVLTNSRANVTFKKMVPTLSQGTLKIEIPGNIRTFKINGQELNSMEREVNLATPTGYLAGLVTGDVDVQIEGLSPDPDCVVAYVYCDTNGVERARDEVHLLLAEYVLATTGGHQIVPLVPAETLRFRSGIFSLPSVVEGKPGWSDVGTVNPQAIFRISLNGLPTSAVTDVVVRSDSGSDKYTDQWSIGQPSYISTIAGCVYEGAGRESLHRPVDTAVIKSNLNLNVVQGATATVTLTTLMDKFTKKIDTLRMETRPNRTSIGGRVLVDYSPAAAIAFKAKVSLSGGTSSWAILSKPEGANPVPASGTGTEFSFKTNSEGYYVVQLTYSVGGVNSSTTLLTQVYYRDSNPNQDPGRP